MSDADDVMAYLVEFKPGDQVRIMRHLPGQTWPSLGTLGWIIARTKVGKEAWLVEFHDNWSAANFYDHQMVLA